MKTLYHGTISLFDKIDASKGKGYKDFGNGFYATGNFQHAERLAKRNKRIALERQSIHGNVRRSVTAYVYDIAYDESVLTKLKYKVFRDGVDAMDWVRFVSGNRACSTRIHNFDIVIGATADDATDVVFNVYRSGGYGDPNSSEAQTWLFKMLESQNLPRQYWFSQKAADMALKIIKRRVVT